MRDLPASPDLDHLKTQAKQLLRAVRAGDQAAMQRFADTLPAARGTPVAALAGRDLALHDAQSVVAREYGFRSWTELKAHVEWVRADLAGRRATWLRWVLDGNARERARAAQLFSAQPDLVAGDPWLACVVGDEAAIRAAIGRDPAWVNRPGGPHAMPPLVAVTHSRLIDQPLFEPRLLACAALLLEHGADPNGTWVDPRFPESPLAPLYGAAGRTHHASMAKLLLDAGANPDDGESLYHCVESPDPACLHLLIDAGVRTVGTNAIARVLDSDRLEALQLLLRHGGHPAAIERPWIHHAILRGRSLAHVQALVDAGVDLRRTNDEGISLFHWALMHGRTDVVDLLRAHGIDEPLTIEDQFVAACTRADTARAKAIEAEAPGVLSRLTPAQLRALPELAYIGDMAAVRTMLALGWPREVKAAWDATALNLAVIRGDAAMARLLLESGADWRTPHGFGNNVIGTLSHASRADDIEEPAPRDYVGCALALLAHGAPLAEAGPDTFSDEVAAVLGGPLPS